MISMIVDLGAGVVSDEISEELGRCLVTEASQAGAIVVGDEGVEVGVAFEMVAKAAMGAQLRSLLEMLAEAAVEALDHAVGLRVKRADQAVGNPILGYRCDRRHARRTAGRAASAFLSTAKRSVNRSHYRSARVWDGERKSGRENAPRKSARYDGAAVGTGFRDRRSGWRRIDRDIGVAAAAQEAPGI